MTSLPAPARYADVAVVIPVYNEATVIAGVVQGIAGHVGRVVCVDDGSRDGSAEVIATTGADLVRHPVNMGQGAAIQTGVEFALMDPAVRWVATFDAAALLDIRHSGMAHASEIVETVGTHRLRHTEVPVHILYTEYSRAKGQSLWNSVNILFDLLFR